MKILKFHENQKITRYGCPDGVLCSLSSRKKVKFNVESVSGILFFDPEPPRPAYGIVSGLK